MNVDDYGVIVKVHTSRIVWIEGRGMRSRVMFMMNCNFFLKNSNKLFFFLKFSVICPML